MRKTGNPARRAPCARPRPPRAATVTATAARGASATPASARTRRRRTPPARDPEHGRRAVGPVEHADEQDAAEGGAGEIGGVEPADTRRKAGQRQTDRDAADDERHGNHDVGEGDRVDRDDRRVHAKRNAELRQKLRTMRDRKGHGRERQLHGGAVRRVKTPRGEIDRQARRPSSRTSRATARRTQSGTASSR